MANIIEKYEGFPITFENKNGKMMVNATQMAKPFGHGKEPNYWLKTQAAKDFIDALSKVRNLDAADLQRVVNGGKDCGTWFHEDVALEYARWLSPKFTIWYNDHIKELLRTGSTSISTPMDYETALERLLVKVKENKRLVLVKE